MSFKHSKDINGLLCEAPRCGAAALIMVLYLPHFAIDHLLYWNVYIVPFASFAFSCLHFITQQRKPSSLSLETSIIYKLGVTILIKTDYALKYENYLIL